MFTDAQLSQASAGEIETLCELDRQGFLVGAGESLQDYVLRLKALQGNTAEMEDELNAQGAFVIEDLKLKTGDRIPSELFAEAREKTQSLFGFAIEWVPGFFVNPKFSWLFGGCAFSFYPDFFALFIIRESFARKKRWIIYRREELLAHELCHVARIALDSRIYEETFAYQTSFSRFRRLIGSMFRSPTDSFLMLGSTMLLLMAQLIRTFAWGQMPVAPFWGVVAAVLLFLLGRHWHYMRQLAKAVRNLERVAPDSGRAIAFRCTDEEILTLASLGTEPALRQWLDARPPEDLRWQIINARFISA
jgi:hypothetical protein